MLLTLETLHLDAITCCTRAVNNPCTRAVLTGARNTLPVFMAHERGPCLRAVKRCLVHPYVHPYVGTVYTGRKHRKLGTYYPCSRTVNAALIHGPQKMPIVHP